MANENHQVIDTQLIYRWHSTQYGVGSEYQRESQRYPLLLLCDGQARQACTATPVDVVAG
jgi:hypothetical protein